MSARTSPLTLPLQTPPPATQNYISGTLPPALGDMSPQLEVAKLNLNRLSGDLPHSVLHWGKNPNMTEDGLELDLLTGNLFSCPPTHGLRAIFGPTLGQDTPLYELDVAGATYQCGTQGWYYPFLESALAALSLVATVPCVWREQRFANALHGEYWSRRNRRFWADDDLGAATANAVALGAVIVAVSTIAVVAMLPLYVGDRRLQHRRRRRRRHRRHLFNQR